MAPKAEDSTPSKGRAKAVPKPAPTYELVVPNLKSLGSYAILLPLLPVTCIQQNLILTCFYF